MVKIITDTTSELPTHLAEKHHIPVIPQLIHFGEQTFVEGRDISLDDFLELLRSSEHLPKTAAPPPDFFQETFSSCAACGEPVLCIHPSSKLSGTVRSATMAAQDFPGIDIRVIDSGLIASPLGVLVQRAAHLADQGADIDSIQRAVESLAARNSLYFLVASLDYLARGGRIGGASALLGNALQLKPILTLREGQVEPYCKERTLNRALTSLSKLVIKDYPSDQDGFLTIMHADAPSRAQKLASELQTALEVPLPRISPLTPAIVTHAGPGAIAVGFFS